MKKELALGSLRSAYVDEGSGRACLFLHGSGANRAFWRTLAERVADPANPNHGRAIRLDLLGHGESSHWDPVHRKSPYCFDDVKILEAIVAQVGGPVDLVGHSAGGVVCLDFAALHPEKVRSLVVVEPMLPAVLEGRDPAAWAEVRDTYQRGHALAEQGQLESAARHLFEYILGDGEWAKLPERLRAWLISTIDDTLTRHSRASLSHRAHLELYPTIQAPTLILYGSATRVPYQRIAQVFAQIIPGARIREVGGAAHNLPISHSREVNEAILAFWGAL